MTPDDPLRRHDAIESAAATAEPIETVTIAYERFMRRLQAQRAPDVVDIGISMAQVKVLHVVGAAPHGLAMTQLAASVGTTLSTVSGLVDRLVDHGFLARHTDPGDRRQVVVSVEPAAIELMDRFRELGRRQFHDLIAHVAGDDLATLTRAFDILERAAFELSHAFPETAATTPAENGPEPDPAHRPEAPTAAGPSDRGSAR